MNYQNVQTVVCLVILHLSVLIFDSFFFSLLIFELLFFRFFFFFFVAFFIYSFIYIFFQSLFRHLLQFLVSMQMLDFNVLLFGASCDASIIK